MMQYTENQAQVCQSHMSSSNGTLLLAGILSVSTLTFLLLPPIIAFIILTVVARAMPQRTLLFFWSATLALILSYFAPIWDNIAHYYRVPYYDNMYSSFWEFLDGNKLFYGLEVAFFRLTGLTQYSFFCFAAYLFIIYSLILVSRNLLAINIMPRILWIFALIGFFPIVGWTRSTIAFILLLLVGTVKHGVWLWGIVALVLGYKIHPSVILLSPIFIVYFCFSKITPSFFIAGAAATGIIFSIEQLGASLLPSFLNINQYLSYMEDARVWAGSDYIFIPLRLILFFILAWNILKYQDEVKNRWLFSFFVITGILYVGTIHLYTIRERIVTPTLIATALLSYPIIQKHYSKIQNQLMHYTMILLLILTCSLNLKPMFFFPFFTDQDYCRTITTRIFYLPGFMLLNFGKEGFSNEIFEQTTWEVN